MTSFTDIEVTANPSVSVLPTGNQITTLTSINVQANAGSSTTREFLMCAGLRSGLGSGTSADKVGIYTGVVAQAGSADIWAQNTLIVAQAAAPTTVNAQGIELDINNQNSDRGNTPGISGMTTPFVLGLNISGTGPYKGNAASVIYDYTTDLWNRGYCVRGSTAQAAFRDYSSATTSLAIEGSHTYGVDLQNSNTARPVRLPNTGAIWARNSGNTADIPLIWTDGSDNIWMGQSSPSILTQCNVSPWADNAYTLGTSSTRWSAIYSAGGVITTSDPALKTDVAPLPAALPLILDVEPKTFKWRIGGMEEVEEEQDQEVQATEWFELPIKAVEFRDGKPIQVTKIERREEYIFDYLPLLDEAGQPVMDLIPARLTDENEHGEKVDELRPRLHKTPRMIKSKVKIKKLVERPGRRTHWGFMAPDIKAAFDRAGVDFAGYVQDDDGRHLLRTDQLIPVLWKGIQELSGQNAALTERLAGLERKIAELGARGR